MGTLSGLSIALISLSRLAIAIRSFDPSLSTQLIAPYKKWWAVPTLQMYKVELGGGDPSGQNPWLITFPVDKAIRYSRRG